MFQYEADTTATSFRQKFKSFIEQYELRELHFQSLMRTKECEVQYNLARYERERKAAENEQTRSRTLSAQVSTFSQTETELRSQLNIYVEKFKQVRQTQRPVRGPPPHKDVIMLKSLLGRRYTEQFQRPLPYLS